MPIQQYLLAARVKERVTWAINGNTKKFNLIKIA